MICASLVYVSVKVDKDKREKVVIAFRLIELILKLAGGRAFIEDLVFKCHIIQLDQAQNFSHALTFLSFEILQFLSVEFITELFATFSCFQDWRSIEPKAVIIVHGIWSNCCKNMKPVYKGRFCNILDTSPVHKIKRFQIT